MGTQQTQRRNFINLILATLKNRALLLPRKKDNTNFQNVSEINPLSNCYGKQIVSIATHPFVTFGAL